MRAVVLLMRPLQLRRVDWNQEMFEGETVPETGKASSGGQPMEVDEESKKVATVDATKVTEEKEDEVEGAGTIGTKRSRRREDKEDGEVSLWADVGGEETL